MYFFYFYDLIVHTLMDYQRLGDDNRSVDVPTAI